MLRAFHARHRAASQWSRAIVEDLAARLDLTFQMYIAPEQWAEYGTLGAAVTALRQDIVMLTNARQSDVDTLPESRGVHLFRDPRDIVVSGYFSHRHSHPIFSNGVVWTELIRHRINLRKLDKDAGMAAEIDFSGYFLDHMVTWDHDNPDVLAVRMEDLVTDSAAQWTRVLDHWRLLELMPPGLLDELLATHTFASMAGTDRKKGEEDQTSHYRKGVAGDWRNHLNDEHLAQFRARYGDLVERLGYQW